MARAEGAAERVRYDELALLVAVAEAGSLAEAARRLRVPKSTVSRGIARVEEDLGVSLVRRVARGPALTEQGRALANVAAPHVSALRDAASALGNDKAEIYGRLRVTAVSDVGAHLLGPLVAAFTAQHPRISVEVDLSTRVVDLLGEGFDVAIRIALSSLPSSSVLVGKRFARLDFGFYASTTYVARRGEPRRAADLTHHDHVLMAGVAQRGALVIESPKGTTRVPVEGRVTGNDPFFIREAVLAGAGIGGLPWFLASADLAAGRLVRVLPEHRVAGSHAYFVHAAVRPVPPKVAAFKAFVLEHAQRLLTER